MLKDSKLINMPKNGMSGTCVYLFMASAKRHHQSKKPHKYAVFSMSMYSVGSILGHFYKNTADLLTVTLSITISLTLTITLIDDDIGHLDRSN